MRKEQGVYLEADGVYINIEPRKPISVCRIIDRKGNLLGMGIGVLKHGDLYDRETGCRMALKSALRDALISGEQRRKIWEAYLERFPASERKSQEALRMERIHKLTQKFDFRQFLNLVG